ncbi:MAG: ribosome small subunit-dependent GTPase A [Clostridia bacterium]|nr:ribosome small subunit-dependent GTPase A [Clostridia bacterium]
MKQDGKIIKGVGGKYTVLCGGETVTARARGVFRHEQISPEVGDNVTVRIEQEGDAYIEDIHERKNLLIRPPMANLDYMFITASAAKPAPILATLDKLSAICVHSDIAPVFVITKCDLDAAMGERLAKLYGHSGFPVFTLSAEDGEGIEELRAFLGENLPGKTAAFAGASGIGKSTLLNALFPELGLATGGISERIARGKHTTRHVELFSALGGMVADTPGFSMLDFMRFDFMTAEDLPYAFPEIEPYLGRCRYTKCTHLCEDGCAIVEAVQNGEIEPSRHESYVELYNILKDKKEWKKVPH